MKYEIMELDDFFAKVTICLVTSKSTVFSPVADAFYQYAMEELNAILLDQQAEARSFMETQHG